MRFGIRLIFFTGIILILIFSLAVKLIPPPRAKLRNRANFLNSLPFGLNHSDFRFFCESNTTDCSQGRTSYDACAIHGVVLRDGSTSLEVTTSSGSLPANLSKCIPTEKISILPRSLNSSFEEDCILSGTTILIVNYQQHIPHFAEGLFYALSRLLGEHGNWMCAARRPCRFLFHSIENWPERSNILWQKSALEVSLLTAPQEPSTLNEDLFNVIGASRSLELTGCTSNQLVFERLVLLPPQSWFKSNLQACSLFRNAALTKFGIKLNRSKKETLIIAFLIRRQSRYIINSNELILALEKRFGVQVRKIAFEGLSFGEQVATMSDVRLFVTPHGAGVTNIVFMPPGSALIEIFPLYHRPHNYFDELSRGCNLWYGAYENTNSSSALLDEPCSRDFQYGLPPLDLCQSRERCSHCGKNSATFVDIAQIDKLFASAQKYLQNQDII
jgi:hypothetical protein